MLAVPIGLALLWLSGLLAFFLSGWGDCFGSDAECQAVRQVQRVHSGVLVVFVVCISVSGLLAVARGRRVLPAVLLGLSLLALVLGGVASEKASSIFWWVPGFLGFLSPALVILALAAAGQILDQSDWRARVLSAFTSDKPRT